MNRLTNADNLIASDMRADLGAEALTAALIHAFRFPTQTAWRYTEIFYASMRAFKELPVLLRLIGKNVVDIANYPFDLKF